MATKDTKRKEQPGYTDNWQKGKSLIASLSYSLEENILCDVTFVVGETRECVRAHRLILSLRSCVFLAMLTGLMAEQDDIEIPDIGADIFNTFLKFLYTDEVFIDGSNVMGLLYASKKYGIDDLEKKCLDYLESSLSPQDVCLVMEQSHVYHEDKLMEKCLKYIWQNGDASLTSDVCPLCHECFDKVIKADVLNADEKSVFEAAMSWSSAECKRSGKEVNSENRRIVLGQSLHLVRFPLLDQDYFDQNVSPTGLLTDAEENKILRYYLFHNDDASPFICTARSRFNTSKSDDLLPDCYFKKKSHVELDTFLAPKNIWYNAVMKHH